MQDNQGKLPDARSTPDKQEIYALCAHEALNVYDQTGLTPRQLAERVKELGRTVTRMESEEASVCPEDTGIVEYVTNLRADRDQLAERVRELEQGFEYTCQIRGIKL